MCVYFDAYHGAEKSCFGSFWAVFRSEKGYFGAFGGTLLATLQKNLRASSCFEASQSVLMKIHPIITGNSAAQSPQLPRLFHIPNSL